MNEPESILFLIIFVQSLMLKFPDWHTPKMDTICEKAYATVSSNQIFMGGTEDEIITSGR